MTYKKPPYDRELDKLSTPIEQEALDMIQAFNPDIKIAGTNSWIREDGRKMGDGADGKCYRGDKLVGLLEVEWAGKKLPDKTYPFYLRRLSKDKLKAYGDIPVVFFRYQPHTKKFMFTTLKQVIQFSKTAEVKIGPRGGNDYYIDLPWDLFIINRNLQYISDLFKEYHAV